MNTDGSEVEVADINNVDKTDSENDNKGRTDSSVDSTSGQGAKLDSGSSFSMNSVASCRICKNSSGMDLVPSPCHCKGSMGTVHKSCLEEWLTGSIRDSCELCSFQYKVVRTRKFTLSQSIWFYMSHHVSFIRLFRDLFFLTVSLMNTVVLMYMWTTYVVGFVLGMTNRDLEQLVVNNPLRGVLYFFFFTLCLMFVSVNAVDDFRRVFYFYFLPWYHWWQTNVDVKLIIDENSTKPKTD